MNSRLGDLGENIKNSILQESTMVDPSFSKEDSVDLNLFPTEKKQEANPLENQYYLKFQQSEKKYKKLEKKVSVKFAKFKSQMTELRKRNELLQKIIKENGLMKDAISQNPA